VDYGNLTGLAKINIKVARVFLVNKCLYYFQTIFLFLKKMTKS